LHADGIEKVDPIEVADDLREMEGSWVEDI